MSFGGGAGGNAVAGGADGGWNGTAASGGTTYDYTSPLGEFRVHKFTSTSATPFSAPGDFDRKVKNFDSKVWNNNCYRRLSSNSTYKC